MRFVLAAAFLVLAGCGGEVGPGALPRGEGPAPALAPSEPGPGDAPGARPLPDRLNCLRESGGVLLIGHRGGPTRDYPENAIETFQRTFDAGTHAMETDISETKDGVLILMHDDDLARTTTGDGLVAEHTLAQIQALRLETFAKTTNFTPPTLAAALDWAVKSNAIFELDKKKSAAWEPIIAAVRAAHAENNVLLVTYTDAQAIALHRLAPDLVVVATIATPAQLDRLISKGVQADHLVAWTGTLEPDPGLWKDLAEHGVEASFGTLGPRATSLDTRYWEDGDGSEFNRLVEDGLAILVTDITDKAARQLAGLRQKSSPCGL